MVKRLPLEKNASVAGLKNEEGLRGKGAEGGGGGDTGEGRVNLCCELFSYGFWSQFGGADKIFTAVVALGSSNVWASQFKKIP